MHIGRAGGSVARVADLVADVRIEHTPRRSLTLYAPTRASWVTVLPAAATLRTAITAEGVRGATVPPVRARIRVETDDAPAIEHTAIVRANQPWTEVWLRRHLAAFANRAARVTSAERAPVDEDGGALPIALNDAGAARTGSVVSPSRTRACWREPRWLPTLAPVRHALFVVVRGLRADRLIPAVNTRMSFGGFSRLAREGLLARVLVPSGRELVALATMLTGLSPEAHRIEDWTDTHDERAPTMGAMLREGGMATALFADDKCSKALGSIADTAKCGRVQGTLCDAARRSRSGSPRSGSFRSEIAGRSRSS